MQPLYDYCDVIWSNSDKTYLDRLLRLQKRGARIILRKKIREECSENLFKELDWPTLTDRWNFHTCLTVFKCLKGLCPAYLENVFSLNSDIHNYCTRGSKNIHMPRISSKSGYRSFAYSAAKLFNGLSQSVKDSTSVQAFKIGYWKMRK